MQQLKKPLLSILIIIVLTESVLLLKSWSAQFAASAKDLRSLAQQVVKKCEDSKYKPTCYEKEIPKFMDQPYRLTMEQVFRLIPQVQSADRSYVYCHVLGHEISAKETKKDPSKWTDVVARCPSGVCSNGCIHGAFQERFRTESLTDAQIKKLIPTLQTVCEKRGGWIPTGMEQASCYHALGHLLMYITSGDTKKSADLCDKTLSFKNSSNLSRVCYDGVFMQIYQPLEPEDYALIKGKQPKRQDILTYCNAFSQERRASCLNESWPLAITNFEDPQDIVGFCSRIGDSGPLVDRCFNAMIYAATVQLGFDETRLISVCKGMPESRVGQCFANVASRMIETDWNNIDRSLRLCATAGEFGFGERCYQEMIQYAYFNFHENSKEQINLCKKMPEPWMTKCIQRDIVKTQY